MWKGIQGQAVYYMEDEYGSYILLSADNVDATKV